MKDFRKANKGINKTKSKKSSSKKNTKHFNYISDDNFLIDNYKSKKGYDNNNMQIITEPCYKGNIKNKEKNKMQLIEEEYEANINKLNITIETSQKDNDKYAEDLFKQISELKNLNKEKEIKIKNLNNEINKYKKIEEKYLVLIEKNKANEEEINKLNLDIDQYLSDIDELKKQLDDMYKENDNFKSQINILNSKNTSLTKEITKITEEKEELTTQIKTK